MSLLPTVLDFPMEVLANPDNGGNFPDDTELVQNLLLYSVFQMKKAAKGEEMKKKIILKCLKENYSQSLLHQTENIR